MGYNVPDPSDAFNVIQCSDSGYAFVGYIGNGSSSFFVKTDKNGYSGCLDSLLPFVQYNDTLIVTSIGGSWNISVSNPLINNNHHNIGSHCVPIMNFNKLCYCIRVFTQDHIY